MIDGPSLGSAGGPEGLRTLRDAVERIGAAMAVPGLTWGVAAGGGSHLGAAGGVDLDSIFRIASITKPIAAALVHGLIDDGVLGLDEPVSRWLPELGGHDVLRVRYGSLDDVVPAREPVTVRHLLAMTSGLGMDLQAPAEDPLTEEIQRAGLASHWLPPSITPHEWVQAAARLPWADHPGERFAYQYSYDALTALVEAATTAPFAEVLRERILAPVGMVDTAYRLSPEQLPRALGNSFPDGDGFVQVVPDADRGLLEAPPFCSAATGLLSTARDLLLFGRMLLDGGEVASGRILSADAIDHLTTPALSAQARAAGAGFLDGGLTWGLGVAIDPDGRYGWDGGTGTSLWVDPAAELVGVILTRQGMGQGSSTWLTDFWDAVRGAAIPGDTCGNVDDGASSEGRPIGH